jgi:Fur family transcriptional regulator, ferric uptake regulator
VGLAVTVAHTAPPVAADDLDSALAAVRSGGLRVTTARRLLLEALWEAREPLSAEELVDRLEGRSDVGSVYRNLEALERLGLIRHVHLGHGPGLYARTGLGPLEYLLCDSCGAHLAVEPSELDGVRELIRKRFGYEARFGHFPVAGLCPDCGRKAGA